MKPIVVLILLAFFLAETIALWWGGTSGGRGRQGRQGRQERVLRQRGGHERHYGRTGSDWDDDLEIDWPNADGFDWDDIEVDRRSNQRRRWFRRPRGSSRGRHGYGGSRVWDVEDELDWLPLSVRRRRVSRPTGRREDVPIEGGSDSSVSIDEDGFSSSRHGSRGSSGSVRLTTALGIPGWFFDGSNIDFRAIFRTRDEEWWTGQHVCTESTEENIRLRNQDSEGLFGIATSFQCVNSGKTYQCITTTECSGWRNTSILTYRCCHGYDRTPGFTGCMKVLHLTDLLTTARALGLTEFLKALDSVGRNETLLANNLTVFAPANEAFTDYVPDEMDIRNYVVLSPDVGQIISSTQRILEGHIVPFSKYQTASFSDNELLDTANPDSQIRINRYPKGVITANCAKITKADNLAENGVIHVVDKVVIPTKENIMDILRKNPELSMVRKAIGSSGLTQVLRQEGPFTLFAPSNEAMSKLNPTVRARLLNGSSDSCLSNILKAHVLPKFLCSAAINNETFVKDLLRNTVDLRLTSDGKIYIDDARIIVRDIVGTNGVIHIIDNVLVTQAVVLDMADREGATDIASLFHAAELDEYLDDMENVTFFLPTNDAIKAIPASKLDPLKREPTALRSLLNYHIARPNLGYSDLKNGMTLSTLNGKDIPVIETTSVLPSLLRRTSKTVQCARVVKSDLWTCTDKAVIHIIDKVLTPPLGNIMDTLTADGRFRIFADLVQRSGMDEQLSGPDDSYTVFAPTDETLDRLIITSDSEDNIQRFVKNHIVRGSLCCASFSNDGLFGWSYVPRLQNLAGNYLTLSSTATGIEVSDIKVISCDISATNGVIHVLESSIWTSRGWLDDWYSRK